MALDEEQRKRGVIAASAGNHALALAYHGRELGIPVTVIMPSIAPLTKITKCQKLEARVILEGDTIADAAQYARENFVEAGERLKYINGFDDFEIIAGAGSVGIEMLEDVRDADAVVIPVGGGGLIAGVALAIKQLKPGCKVIGVEPERCASMTFALKAGEPVLAPTTSTLADGLAVPTVGPRSFETVRNLIDELVLVSESDIALAMFDSSKTKSSCKRARASLAWPPFSRVSSRISRERRWSSQCAAVTSTRALSERCSSAV